MRIVIAICLAIFALFLLFAAYVFVVGIVALVLKALFLALLVITVVYFFFPKLFDKIVSMFKQKESVRGPRLWDSAGQVRVYVEKPNLAQIIGTASASSALSVANDTSVTIIEDDGDVIKLKLHEGDNKGKVVWASRASVVGHIKAINKQNP
ncbi:MAG: hypothetical protein K2W95_26515 [Candidatus Obscuribacterales bacterium]|nr:hypothetical protein [Candidatus Obscuribacterales bacterium]